MTTVLLVFLLLFLFLLTFFTLGLSLSFFFGAPFVPTPLKVVKEMVNIAKINQNDIVVDFGSGDGRLLIESAKKGAIAQGWEINIFLVYWTKLKAMILGLHQRINMHNQSYSKAEIKNASVVFCYSMPRFIVNIEKKLQLELPRGAKIIAYKFPFPNLKLVKKTKSGIYLYSV